MKRENLVSRVFSTLDLFNPGRKRLSVTEVAQELKITKSMASRIMSSLESKGVLVRVVGSRDYCLGGKIIKLSKVFFDTVDLGSIAYPFMKRLNERINELIILNVIKGDKSFCSLWIESTRPIRYVIDENTRFGPLYAVAPGKILLANLPESEIDQILDRVGIEKYTKNTIIDRSLLKSRLKEIRETGISISDGEYLDFAWTTGSPIRDQSGKVVAALGISCVKERRLNGKRVEYSNLVKETADLISSELGYSPLV